MHIAINTDDGPLSDTDKAVLRALLGETSTTTAAPAAKAAPGKKTAAAKPDPEPEDDSSDDAGDDDSDGTTSLEDAVTQAKKMVANGDAAKVKKALTAVGAKKVSEIPADKVDEFVAALG